MDKRALAAVREYHALRKKEYHIIKLDKPIQRGWRRFYTLNARARARADRAVLEAILEVIGPVVINHRRDFLKRCGRRSRKLVEIEQPLNAISYSEWDRKRFPDGWRKYFRSERLPGQRQWYLGWVFAEPSLYELKIEPNWLWYFREVDPIVASRLSELDSWLHFHGGWERYHRMKGIPRYYRWCEKMEGRQKCLVREHQREIMRAIADFPEVDSTALSLCSRLSFRPSPAFSPCSPISRGTCFRNRSARVQILPWGLFPFRSRSPMQRHPA